MALHLETTTFARNENRRSTDCWDLTGDLETMAGDRGAAGYANTERPRLPTRIMPNLHGAARVLRKLYSMNADYWLLLWEALFYFGHLLFVGRLWPTRAERVGARYSATHRFLCLRRRMWFSPATQDICGACVLWYLLPGVQFALKLKIFRVTIYNVILKQNIVLLLVWFVLNLIW